MSVFKAQFKSLMLVAAAGGALLCLPVAAAAATPAAPAAAARPAGQERAFIQQMGNEVIGYLKNSGMPDAERKARLKQVLQTRFDVATISRFALGKYWKQLTPAQQQEYQTLFADMVVSMYAERFSTYSGQEFKVHETVPAENDMLVKSSIIDPEGEKKDIAVDWRVRTKDGQMQIVDVTIENVSMIITQRSEFDSLIQREGGNAAVILDHLRSKLADG